MENNKILIGVQFAYSDTSENSKTGSAESGVGYHTLELYVLRDITLQQLMDGIEYGLRKRADANNDDYRKCYEIYQKCISAFKEENKRRYYSHIRLGFCHQEAAKKAVNDAGERLTFQKGRQIFLYCDSCFHPLCELGFINSSRLIFTEKSGIGFEGAADTSSLAEAFAPVDENDENKGNADVNIGRKITFPEYNISSRQLYRFDDTPVEIIPPQEPPRKPVQSLFTMLLPSLLTLTIMMGGRVALMGLFSGNAMNGLQMALFSGLMTSVAIITTILTWRRQGKEYRVSLSNWRVKYENYINHLMEDIRKRQENDAKKMKELYPDVEELIEQPKNGTSAGEKSVYSLNGNIYSRSPNDEDFLSFRVGLSDDVESRFAIKGEEKNVVFSEAYFTISIEKNKNGEKKDKLRLYLGSEYVPEEDKPVNIRRLPGATSKRLRLVEDKENEPVNISRLAGVISKRFRFMEDTPFLYSLKNARAVGVVDYEADSPSGLPCAANLFITRMIFELCYYHSPENLQFVMFFPGKSSADEKERLMAPYKFMPHFRELFPDRSQFVFDEQSAGLVLSGLLNLMERRQAAGSDKTPHVVLIVYNEYSLREHAFAEFLPEAPETSKGFENTLGLTFVYVTKHWEYLPHYCDSVFTFENKSPPGSGIRRDYMTWTPRNNVAERKEFRYPFWTSARNRDEFWEQESVRSGRAFQFLSAVYYTRIAENGKVPSAVSLYELLPDSGEHLEDTVRKNWGLSAQERGADITKSLRVPIGKTDTDTDMAYLDLHEKSDGPHMLVAGSTGSGKTETIISYLLELCVTFRPDELNLLLVDMKGGGFTKRIGMLPHVVGAVTDVDGDENGTGAEYMLHRFLDAMRSEIKRRKTLFNQMHVDNIDDYIRACRDIESYVKEKEGLSADDINLVRKTAGESPLSHIMLVVDEFTELKQFTRDNDELDFMGEITKIARIGRSLGFHILLISQNIEGAITDDIRVNSNARLCLKVATRQASREMLGTDVAFSPSMPGHGRAYLKTLNRETLSYFQSGYSAASVSKGEKLPFEITLASKLGMYEPFFMSKEKDEYDKKQAKKNGAATKKNEGKQLSAIVRAIAAVHEEHRQAAGNSVSDNLSVPFHDAHIVFHPPLPARIMYHNGDILDLSRQNVDPVVLNPESDGSEHSLKLPMGLYDHPLEQKQPVFYLDFYRCNTAVYGVASSGKTTFVKTFLLRIHDMREPHPPENIYILDFSANLGSYRDLPDVCACFGSNNEEDVKRVFYEIERRMEENAETLGSQNYKSRLEDRVEDCPPHMTLIIENLNAFLSNDRYAVYQDQLLQFCRDGLSKGLSVIFTASDTSGTGRFLSAFRMKVAFEMPTDSYYDIFGNKVTPPIRLAGRGVVALESAEYEFQCFDPFRTRKSSERDEEEKNRIQSLARAAGDGSKDRKLKMFDKVLTAEACMKVCAEMSPDVLTDEKICVGLDYKRHKPVCVDIRETPSIAIYGKRHFGKTNLLRILLEGVLRFHSDARFVLLDGGKGQLTKKQLPELYRDAPPQQRRYFPDGLDKFWTYLYHAHYCEKEPRKKQELNPEWLEDANSPVPFTVFVIQSRKLYHDSTSYLVKYWLPEAVSDAPRKKYLLIFTDVKPTDPEITTYFNSNITAAFLLDNIAEFVADRGAKSVFGELDAKELKSRYAHCSLGDGYFYDMEDETKLKFILYGSADEPERTDSSA